MKKLIRITFTCLIVFIAIVSYANTATSTFSTAGVCTDTTTPPRCTVTNASGNPDCHTIGSSGRTVKTDGSTGEINGYCECTADNKQKCYDRSALDYGCIPPEAGKLSTGDGSYCRASCPSGCLADNFVCYSTSGSLKSNGGGGCECATQINCYSTPNASTSPSCSAPGTTNVSQNNYGDCVTTSGSGAKCTADASKCWFTNRAGNNVCYGKNATPNLASSASLECNCTDPRHCFTYNSSNYNDVQCQNSALVLSENYISRWSTNEFCRNLTDDASDFTCANNDQCWHPVNRVCTPHNAYGHSRGECKRSQYILVLNNQIVEEGYEGEFHPVFIVNSFNDLYSDLGNTGLQTMTTAFRNYYNSNFSWPNVDDSNSTSGYLFAHVRKTFQTGDSYDTPDTYEYWNFGGNIAGDQYQQEQIKKGKYLWNFEATQSEAGSDGYFMVFWYPTDTTLASIAGTDCYIDRSSRGTNDIKKNDIRPIFLKMRYFYKLTTAQNFVNLLDTDNKPYLLLKKTANNDDDYVQLGQYGDSPATLFIPADTSGNYITIREILMGFYSAKCTSA